MIDMQALSVAALWGATILYAVAMVAYSIRLAAEADARVQVKRLATVGAGAGTASGGEDLAAAPLPQRARKALGIARSGLKYAWK